MSRPWSVMDAPASDQEVREFEEWDTENRLEEERFEREIAAAKNEHTQTQINPLDNTDPRGKRLFNTEGEARRLWKDYDAVVDRFLGPYLEKNPQLARVLCNSSDPAKTSYRLAQVIRDPRLLSRPEYQGLEEYVRDLDARGTGIFEGLTPEQMERLLDAFKESGEDSLEDFFNK
jgi:hypothetical protein